MPYRSFYDQQPQAEHLAKRERPAAVASLFVHTAEWTDLNRILAAHGPTEIVGVRKLPFIPAVLIEVGCRDQSTALAIMEAWLDYSHRSPHRPHTRQECEVWGRKMLPEITNIPPQ